jgi:4-amino-4-deoxy-L-arabinose transferase-like glycosyltransferase
MTKRREIFILFLIFFIFLILRLPAIHSPYHQDEYKWVQYSHPEIVPSGTVPHPPLTEFIYTRFGPLVGDDNFRLIPLIFSIFNFLLIFYLVKIIFDKKTALWTAFLFAISFYSVLASLMVDVDGAVMPFFFLLMAVGYFKLKSFNFEIKEGKWKWLVPLLAGAIGGFLIKVSFFLPLAALAIDFAIDKKVFLDKKKLLKYFLWVASVIVFLILVLFTAKFIFPFFNLEYAFKYWLRFAVFKDRGWLQTFIQFIKGILYISPILLLPLLFIDKETAKKLRLFLVFLALGMIFYLVLFDFSQGALDRYLQFVVVPLSIVSAGVVAKIFASDSRPVPLKYIFLGVAISLILFSLQFVPHFVPPQYPKTEWLTRVLHFKWNFLFPFSGGSGPLPFYVSWLFIALSWLATVILSVLIFLKRNLKKSLLVAILIIAFTYNFVFIEEYLFGRINGSAWKLVYEATAFIKNNQNIKKVVVYNDNGGWEIRETGKYERRMYAAPQFEDSYETFLSNFKGHVLYIDIPRVDPESFYKRYFDSCKIVYKEVDGRISSTIYDCRKALDFFN